VLLPTPRRAARLDAAAVQAPRVGVRDAEVSTNVLPARSAYSRSPHLLDLNRVDDCGQTFTELADCVNARLGRV
jgi:hypothetical protein